MKIVQFSIRFLPVEGGTERATYYLSRELALNGHQVSIVTSNSNNGLTDKVITNYRIMQLKTANYPPIEKMGRIVVYRHPYLSFWNKSSPILSLPLLFHNLNDFDVIHLQGINMTSSFALLSLITRLKGRKYVATTHGIAEFSTRSGFEISYVIHLYLKHAERIITLCDYESKTLIRLGVPEEKIVIIPNGVDLTRFKNKPTSEESETLRKKYGLRKMVVISVGRVVGNKGFENLIKAAVSFKNEDMSFVIVGPTPDKQYLQKLYSLINSSGLGNKFLMMGWLPDYEVVNLLFLADIFVFPSTVDTFGLVNLDAMAAGKPVIATSTGGVPEVVRDGESGIIIKPGDFMELSKALRKLVNDRALRESMGETGQKLVLDNYSWGEVCSKTLSVYRRLC